MTHSRRKSQNQGGGVRRGIITDLCNRKLRGRLIGVSLPLTGYYLWIKRLKRK